MQFFSGCAGSSTALRPSYAAPQPTTVAISIPKPKTLTPAKPQKSIVGIPLESAHCDSSQHEIIAGEITSGFIEGEIGGRYVDNEFGSYIRGEADTPITEQAIQYIGSRYKSGATGPNAFDCSGYVWRVYSEVGIDISRASSGDYFKKGEKVDRHEAIPGDMIFFRERGRINHVGIYLGSDKFIHSSSGRGVIESSMDDDYWKPRIAGFRRFGS